MITLLNCDIVFIMKYTAYMYQTFSLFALVRLQLKCPHKLLAALLLKIS